MHQFNVKGPVDLRLDLQAGRVRLIADSKDLATVELRPVRGDAETQALIDRAEVSQSGDRITVSIPHERRLLGWLTGGEGIEAIIRLPARSAAQVRVGSASVDAIGVLGAVSIRAGSGAVRVETAGEIDIQAGSGRIDVAHAVDSCLIRSGSGRIGVGTVDGDCRITSGSGSVTVGQVAGALSVNAASGAMDIEEASSDVDLMAASGAISVARTRGGRLRARTASGRIRIGVADGVAAWVDVNTISGHVQSELDAAEPPTPEAPRVELRLNTVSGSVQLHRSTAAPLAA